VALQRPIQWASRPSDGYAACTEEEQPMMDILMIALGVAFFAAAIGYTYACERL
jgi:hypothetical protein